MYACRVAVATARKFQMLTHLKARQDMLASVRRIAMIDSSVLVLPLSYPTSSTVEKPKRFIYTAPPDESRICEICEKPFTCRQREWANNFRKRRTCGRKCGTILSGRVRTHLPEKTCPWCEKLFKPFNWNDKFCSQACYGNSKKGKPSFYISPPAIQVEVTCPQCGRVYMRPNHEAKRGRRFCNRTCFKLFHATHGLGTFFPTTDDN